MSLKYRLENWVLNKAESIKHKRRLARRPKREPSPVEVENWFVRNCPMTRQDFQSRRILNEMEERQSKKRTESWIRYHEAQLKKLKNETM